MNILENIILCPSCNRSLLIKEKKRRGLTESKKCVWLVPLGLDPVQFWQLAELSCGQESLGEKWLLGALFTMLILGEHLEKCLLGILFTIMILGEVVHVERPLSRPIGVRVRVRNRFQWCEKDLKWQKKKQKNHKKTTFFVIQTISNTCSLGYFYNHCLLKKRVPKKKTPFCGFFIFCVFHFFFP